MNALMSYFVYFSFSAALSQKNVKRNQYFDKNKMANRVFLYNQLLFLSDTFFPIVVNIKRVLS